MGSFSNPNLLPASFIRCMGKQQRKELNVKTQGEIDAKLQAKAEREVHRDIANWLRQHNIWFAHSRMDRKTTQSLGVPDFILCVPNGNHFGFPYAIEVKVGGNTLTAEQEATRIQMERCGWAYHVVSSLDELMKVVAI